MTELSLNIKLRKGDAGTIEISLAEGQWLPVGSFDDFPPVDPEEPIDPQDPEEQQEPIAPWQRILDLAQLDGWKAIYDPTNPNTRVIRDSNGAAYIVEIRDGLGNLPPLVQPTASSQPEFVSGGFGALDAVNGATGKVLATASFPTLPQPNCVMAIGKAIDRSGVPRIVDSPLGGRHLIGLYESKWCVWANSYVSSGPSDGNPHLFDGVFDGAASSLSIDGGVVAKGNAGADSLGSLSFGGKVGGSSAGFWKGPMSVVAIHDNPTDEIRGRMAALLMDLAGITPSRFSLLDKSAGLSVPNCQAVAFDGSFYYVSTSEYLYKYTRTAAGVYNLVASRNVAGDTPTGKTQINGLNYFNGYLWAGANNWQGSPKKGWVMKFNPSDLSHVASYEVAAHYAEGGAWKDVGSGPEFWSIYTDYDHVTRHRFNGTAFEQVGEYLLPLAEGQSATNLLYQSAAWIGDTFITSRKPNPTPEIHFHKWTGSGFDAEFRQPGFAVEASTDQLQGLHWEVEGQIMAIALRGASQRIIRASYLGS
ncbi:hypothetical protein [Agrobacterium rosae]|uniref:hypothetical protein n=1 Tax=Agrobacterium rosae TaxID=1972867 RepID=UPI003B9E63FC